MKLRTKLLLGVGLLLFAMAIMIYILPTFFVRKDVVRAVDEIHELLIAEHQQLIQSQRVWLQDALETTKENNDALLFMLYDAPTIRNGLIFDSTNPEKNIWVNLSRIIGYDPSIGFVQAHAPDKHSTAVIAPDMAKLYSVNSISKQGDQTFISLLDINSEKGERKFVGYPISKEKESDEYAYYALIDPKKQEEQVAEVQEEITHLTPKFVERKLSNAAPWISPLKLTQPVLKWAIKINMTRILTPLYFEGLEIAINKTTVVPEGLVRIDKTGNGYGILSQEIFFTQPLFDDALYYKLHLPNSLLAPIASGSAVVADQQNGFAYIGNTILLDHTYFSIGTPLNFLARQLALSSNKMVVGLINQNVWIAFDGEGNQLEQKIVDQIINQVNLQQKNNIVEIDHQSYFFDRIDSLENGRVMFFGLHAFSGENSIISPLLTLGEKLSGSISKQLFLVALVTMLLVLLFIARIGYTVIHPVTQLATATQDVVAGRYTDINLPDVGTRQDEIAILTHSFSDMVEGLQEREKIRGVLDKVVSKDVADEILRTQIHLGGEDRVVSMLFCDIRGFTKLTAKLPPQKTIEMLNACMTKVSRVIEGEGGVIDKYVGDEVMAIFGAPTTHPDHALRAVSTGMLIVETLKKWNISRVASNEPPIEMGIGIHTGLVVAGNMGAEDRLNYTVLGANVNLAARLCEAAKENQLLISEATLFEPKVSESFYTQPLTPLTLKGFSEPAKVFEIIGFKWEET